MEPVGNLGISGFYIVCKPNGENIFHTKMFISFISYVMINAREKKSLIFVTLNMTGIGSNKQFAVQGMRDTV
jgi:hypothetical protein